VFFFISKAAWFFAGPINLVVVLGALGAGLLFSRWKRAGRRLSAAAAIGLLLIGFSPLPKLIARPLEDRFPERTSDGRPVDGIIVLGGGIGFSRGQVTFNEAAARMTTGTELAKKHPNARLVFAGGEGALFGSDRRTEADAAGDFFRTAGIEGERLVMENRSRNTRENALFTRELIRAQPGERWLLVTSAFHMPRAIGCFRAVGLDPEAYPVDYRTDGDARDVRPFIHMANGLQLTDLAVKEWIGLIAYRLAGYTADLLPRP
jgi:uncharacterized SAM-binding protein YcdF (DUF218 family)